MSYLPNYLYLNDCEMVSEGIVYVLVFYEVNIITFANHYRRQSWLYFFQYGIPCVLYTRGIYQ